MSSRFTKILIGIVVLPLAIVGWLVGRTVSSEQEIAQQRFHRLAVLELEKVNVDLAAVFEGLRRDALEELASLPRSVGERRRWTRDSLLATQLYVIDADGHVYHPPIADPMALTLNERESLTRTSSVWDGGALMAEVTAAGESGSTEIRDGGWFTWYWGTGIRWILWQRSADWIQAIELDRVRVLSEIINALPETRLDSGELASVALRLTDAANQTVYQWGQVEPGEGSNALARIPAIDPLSSWSLEYHTATLVGPAASHFGMVGGWIAIIVAVSILAIYLHREHSRSLREAGQRVTFVNQVSHELKTPLTNIRMYAELMSADGMRPDDPHRRHLEVIVSESQRLSRLISNVLTLGVQQKRPIELHRRPIVLDEIVDNVMGSFQPALEGRQIEIDHRLDAGRPIHADPDRLEQIIGNLVSNVEKYAHAGRYLGIRTQINGDCAELWVEDKGSGIPDAAAKRVFDPFFRVGDSLTEGVSGTGIGLSIARDLARLHGGDLTFERTPSGSRFRLTIPIGPESV